MFNKSSALRSLTVILSLFLVASMLIYCSKAEEENASEEQRNHRRALENMPELADAMGQMQNYTHKYALAVNAENHELATFYFHEVRASADGIKKNIPGYEGYDIDRFMKMFLDPTLEPVETALANRNWEEVRARTIEMVDACNSCHNATSHGFIDITPGFDNNPYNQDFSGGQ